MHKKRKKWFNSLRPLYPEVLEDRYQNSSTIVISQLPVKEWYNMIGNATVADAFMDRLVHNSHRIELCAESMRKLAQSDQLE